MSITMNMRWMKTIMVAAALAVGAFVPGALPQAYADSATGSVHGHVQNAAGITVGNGDVKLTKDSNPSDTSQYKYDMPVDTDGNYKSDGIDAGTYTAVFFQGPKMIDVLNHVKVEAGQDATVDFDMTRQEFIDKLTGPEKEELAKYKARIAATSAENAKIAGLNNNLKQARDLMKASHANCTTPKPDDVVCPPPSGNYDNAATLLQAAITAKPDQAILYFTLGDAQTGQKKYDDAATSYQKAIDLNDASKKPNPDLDSASYNNLGQAKVSQGKIPDGVAAYEAAAKANPAHAEMYYGNEAAALFNHGDTDASLAAADKAIAADPTQPDPYFVRGESLIQKATVDKSGKIVAPAGCADAYQKYLELAPDGPHAQEAKDILTSLGETVHTSFKKK
jgi:hypothetical protein